MRQDNLPAEFLDIANKVFYVHQKSSNEFSGSCPECGGTVHQNGDFPDRFVMFRVGRYGFPLGFCRKCGYRWTPKNEHKPTNEEIEEFRKQQIEVENARIEAAKRTIELLQNDKLWELFYENNNGLSREEFRKRGISDTWVDYCQLGIINDYLVKNGEDRYHSPAFTIPVWGIGGGVNNIKLRIANPRNSGDRYRNYYPTGQSSLFIPMHDIQLDSGSGLIIEGEYKSIVVAQELDSVDMHIVGVQTKTPAPELFEQLANLEPIYIGLDPDAFVKEKKAKETPVQRLTNIIGKERTRIIEWPCKPDDGILQGMRPEPYIRMAKKA